MITINTILANGESLHPMVLHGVTACKTHLLPITSRRSNVEGNDVRNIYDNWNEAVRYRHGETAFLMDSDVVLKPGVLEYSIQALVDHDLIVHETGPQNKRHGLLVFRWALLDEISFPEFTGACFFHRWFTLVKRAGKKILFDKSWNLQEVERE